MNIQNELIESELLWPVVIVASLVALCIIFRLIKNHNEEYLSDSIDPCEACTDSELEKVHIRVGKTYYRRLTSKNGIPLPWPDGMSPTVRVLARRGDWVKYVELEGGDEVYEEFIDAVEFFAYFMEDEFNDFAMQKLEEVKEEPEITIDSLDAEVGFIPDELPEIPVANVIQIDGKDYVLSPVKEQ